MNYHCNEFDYLTDSKSNWYHHKKTQKHIENIKSQNDLKNTTNATDTTDTTDTTNTTNTTNNHKYDEYRCQYCKNIFAYKSNLIRHNKTCSKKICNDNSDVLRKQLETEIENKYKEKYQQILDVNLREINLLKTTLDRYEKIVDNASGMASKSVSALSFLAMKHKDAPPLKQLKSNDVKAFIDFEKNQNQEDKKYKEPERDYRFVERIIFKFKKNTLVEFLADIITKNYKKNDPDEQSIWNSDVSRLSYLIKEASGKKSEWVSDKKGIKLIKYVIDPLTELISTMIKEYISDRHRNIMSYDKEKSDRVRKYMSSGTDLLTYISENKLSNNICKELASYFHLDKNYQKKISDYRESCLSESSDSTNDI